MEFDSVRSSTSCPVYTQSLNSEEELSSDSSSYEWLHKSSARNYRKCLWKGDDNGNTIDEALVPQNYPKFKIQPKKEKTVCTFIRKKERDIGHSFQNKLTTIKLTNVPVKINNILDLYRCFNRFGTITLIQAQRNSNPYCAILSFLTSEDATNAIENARKIIPNVRANWFADVCLLTRSNVNYVYVDNTCSSENTNRAGTDDIDLSDKLSCTQLFKTEDGNCNDRSFDTKYEQNLEIIITELIRKKRRLLLHQMNSMREIIEKINKSEIGSHKEKILSQLLKRVQDQVHDNRRSIEHSIKQRAEYFAKRKHLSQPKPFVKLTSNCPPWITAFKAVTAKRAENVKYERKRRKNRRTMSTNINDSGSSSSDSETSFTDSSTSTGAPPAKLYSNFCRKTVKRPKRLHANVGNARADEQRYECEMERLLSEDSDIQELYGEEF